MVRKACNHEEQKNTDFNTLGTPDSQKRSKGFGKKIAGDKRNPQCIYLRNILTGRGMGASPRKGLHDIEEGVKGGKGGRGV